MRLLLVNPPYPVCESLTMPLGLLYLAARLEEAGHEVFLEDLQLCRGPLRRLREALERCRPRAVGVTSFSLNLPVASKILRAAKRILPDAFTLWGGPHATFDDKGILSRNPWVDAIVRGEGEETLVDLAGRIDRRQNFANVPGVTWRKDDRSLQRNPDRPFREALDSLPRPAWHLLKLSQYRAFGDGASLFTSRGCPHKCAFCVGRKMIGARGRFRDPVAVVDEMEALVRLGFPRVRVEDDLFTFRKERALAICREITRRALAVRWRAYARVDTVDRELLSWMRQAGCERILFGVESGSSEILLRIRKGITPDQARSAVRMAREEGIGVLASFVLGLPGETPETLRQTLEFADSLQVPYSLNLLTPYVGTEIRENAAQWGLRILSSDWRLYGQGRPLTATAEVGPWHLSRAVKRYHRAIRQYLNDLLAAEQSGNLTPENTAELQRHRHGDFLRRLIGNEILERYGRVPPSADGQNGQTLAATLAPHLGMTAPEVGTHLEPHLAAGRIVMKGKDQWTWA